MSLPSFLYKLEMDPFQENGRNRAKISVRLDATNEYVVVHLLRSFPSLQYSNLKDTVLFAGLSCCPGTLAVFYRLDFAALMVSNVLGDKRSSIISSPMRKKFPNGEESGEPY